MKNFINHIGFNFESSSGKLGIGDVTINLYVMALGIAKIVGIIILMWLAIKISRWIINRTVEKQSRSELRFSLDERKSKTIGAVLKSILKYTVYFFGITAILTIIFGGISLTFASIGGVAIGFGAQNLVKDVINGFFILFEDQFSVGDYINIEDKGGIVESVELRVTKIRDFNGDLHIIPNGLITRVTNHSRGNMRILVEVDVDSDENIDRVIEVLNVACAKFKKNQEDIIEGPTVLGITSLKENNVTIRIVGKAKTMKQWDCEISLRMEIKKAFKEANIGVTYPRRRIIKEE
jgi:small-conductance mechanosensitive channel